MKKGLIARMVADLARSGIDKKYIDLLQLKTLTPLETDAYMRGSFGLPTYEIPYFNASGKRTGYSRLKNLATLVNKRPGRPKKPLKYLQRANTAPHLYIPPVIDWPKDENGKIVVNRLVVTEGEKKAIKACLCGIPCVALGGVESFKSSKRGISLVTEFDSFDLSQTKIEICYDSDLNTNENVNRAMHSLMGELLCKHPLEISFVMLDGESTNNGKQGLDDFLCCYATERDARKAFNALPRELDKRQSVMSILDREICYLESAGKLYNIECDRYYGGANDVLNDLGPKYKVSDPQNPTKQIPAVKLWLETRGENTWCSRLVYEPGNAARYKPAKENLDVINLWRPSNVKPINGDVSLWLKLVRYIMVTDQNYEWFLQWLAYPLQHPGTKMYTAVFVYSFMEGVGKNFIIDPLIKKIYGRNYSLVGSTELEGTYNGWAKCKQFVFGDEIYMSDRRDRISTMGRLKSFITNDDIIINEKYRPQETLRNCAQLYITSNNSEALAMSAVDRRMFVVHAPEERLPTEFYEELHKFCKRENAAAMVLSYLLNEVDCSQFNPRDTAPYTEEKEEIIEDSKNLSQSYVQTLVDYPDTILNRAGIESNQDIFTAQELHALINHYAKDKGLSELRTPPNSLGVYLAQTRLPKKMVRFNSRYKKRLYAVRHIKQWRTMTDKQWREYYMMVCPDYMQKSIKEKKFDAKKANHAALEKAVSENKVISITARIKRNLEEKKEG